MNLPWRCGLLRCPTLGSGNSLENWEMPVFTAWHDDAYGVQGADLRNGGVLRIGLLSRPVPVGETKLACCVVPGRFLV